MKQVRFVLVAALTLAVSGAHTVTAAPPPKASAKKEAVAGELIVRFKAGATEVDVARAYELAGVKEKRKLGRAHTRLVEADKARERKQLALLEDHPAVAYAEPNYRVAVDVLPNDGSFGQLWGLHNTGQTVDGAAGTADADIDAPEAWDVVRGSKSVVVGVIDTGVDFAHPDLASAQWVNSGENCTGCRTNAVDDDGNGYVDDWRGWDFVANDNDPTDDHGHGTHVAGTIGATADDSRGVAGVANVSIAGLKFLDAGGYGTTADAVRAVHYANAAGIQITNNSWGGGGFSQALFDAIREGDARGTLFVAAAGNDGTSNDSAPHYPSNYELPNVISVAATDSRDALASFSNYGNSVHLGAPGVSIYSTVLANAYDWYSGTSMATPHVAGAAALAKTAFPAVSGVALKALLVRTGDAKTALGSGRTSSGNRLNVSSAVRCAAPVLWLDAPRPAFRVAVGQPVTVNALVGCGSATVTATVNGSAVDLTPRGDGLWSGSYVPTAAGSLTLTASSGTETRSVTGTVVDDYWQSHAQFAWVDATAGGTRLALGDDSSATVALPFGFSFYKTAYTSLKVSSNGYLVFGASAATEYWNEPIPTSTQPNGLVAAFWDDLNPGGGGSVWYRTVGAAPDRKFVVSWIDVPHYGTSNGATFQVILEESTNAIVYQYRDTFFGDSISEWGGSATVGIEDTAGTRGHQFLYRQQALEDYENATAIRYSIGAPPPPPGPDTTPPPVPSGLVATAGNGSVALDWADSGAGDLAGYRVYRQAADGSWSLRATVTASAYTDTGLVNGTAYTYRVTAHDTAGNESAPSASATATPADAPVLTTYAPSGATIVQGSLSSGTVGSLSANDGNRLVIQRVSRVADFYAETTISAAALASLRKLSVTYDGNANATDVTMRLYVYNWSTSSWQLVDGPVGATTGDRTFTWTNTTSPRDYVSAAGVVQFRVRGVRSSSSGFTTRTDLVRFATEH